jgi:hypothetical protein
LPKLQITPCYIKINSEDFLSFIYLYFLLRVTHVAILLVLTWRLMEFIKNFNEILFQGVIFKLDQPHESLNYLNTIKSDL